MRKKYLLDTNVLSEAVKTAPDANLMTMLQTHEESIVTAAPVWHELRYGCLRLPSSRKRDLVQAYLEEVIRRNLAILPYDERAAQWHAEERARLSAIGKTPSFVDCQIAAVSKVNALVLVTRNTSDFAAFEGLQIENWHSTE